MKENDHSPKPRSSVITVLPLLYTEIISNDWGRKKTGKPGLRTSLLSIGNPYRNRLSGSLFTRVPDPLAISFADATYRDDDGVHRSPSPPGNATVAGLIVIVDAGAAHRAAARAIPDNHGPGPPKAVSSSSVARTAVVVVVDDDVDAVRADALPLPTGSAKASADGTAANETTTTTTPRRTSER